MIRGTSHIFRFDCSDIIDNITDAKSFEATFEQSNNNNSPIIKKFDVFFEGDPVVATVIGDDGCSVNIDAKEVIIELTPEETILFMEDRKLQVQLKGTTIDTGATFANYIQYITVYPMLAGQNNRAISGGGNSTYVLPVASSNTLGGVKVDPVKSNININDGLISVTSENVINMFGYTPANVVETVYVGEEEPSNEEVQIWVHPTEEDLSSSDQPDIEIPYDQVPVSNGGTGLSCVTVGSYLVGNGTESLIEKTPAEVLDDIGTIPVSKGGTGADNVDTALLNLGIKTGTWRPICNCCRPDEGTYIGHYVKINDMVTITFYVQANINDETGYFCIDGSYLPWEPVSVDQWWAGGGYQSGLYTKDNTPDAYFVGWVLRHNSKDNTNHIYARVNYRVNSDGDVKHEGTGTDNNGDQLVENGGYMHVKREGETYPEIRIAGSITYKATNKRGSNYDTKEYD